MLLVRKSRNRQPQRAVGIDWGNPITQGMLFCYLPGLREDLTKRTSAGSFGASVTSARGASMICAGTSGFGGLIVANGTGPLLGPLQTSTVFAIASTTLAAKTLYCERSSTDIYKLMSGPTNGANFVYRNDAGTILQQQVTNAAAIDGKPHSWACVKDGTTHSVYSDDLTSSGTFGSGSSAFTEASIYRILGMDPNSGEYWNGVQDLVVGWGRALSAAELALLRANPYQIFAPQSIPFPESAGGGSPDGNATGAPAATSLTAPTATGSGSAQASAAPASSSLTAPTATASASAQASGALAVSSLTAPTATATGSALASGAPAGVTLTAPTGTASAAGNATATGAPAGTTLTAPTATASGSATASGALAGTTLTAPTGTATSAGHAIATGAPAGLTLTAPTATARADAQAFAVFMATVLTAPTATASNGDVASVLGSLAGSARRIGPTRSNVQAGSRSNRQTATR